MSIVILLALVIRTYAYYKFSFPLSYPPIPAVVGLFVAYKLGKKYDQSVFNANTDVLTKIYNRRYISTKFDYIMNKAIRNQLNVCVFLMDCNKFKDINDQHGHTKGDLTLKTIAAVLMNNKSQSDIVSRWGGDEFLVVRPNTTQSSCLEYINQVNKDLAVISEKLYIPISVSAGFTICSQETSLITAIAAADTMMYKQKQLL